MKSMAVRVSTLDWTIADWLRRAAVDSDPDIPFETIWLRCAPYQSHELQTRSTFKSTKSHGSLIVLRLWSFSLPVGEFVCRVSPGDATAPLRFSAPIFSNQTRSELIDAVLRLLWQLAPVGSRLEVPLFDDPSFSSSSLAVAEQYVRSGWFLSSNETELINDAPRTWIFCFRKNV